MFGSQRKKEVLHFTMALTLAHEEVLRNLHVLANLQPQQKLVCHGNRLDIEQSFMPCLSRRVYGMDRKLILQAAQRTCKMGEEIFKSYINNIYVHGILCTGVCPIQISLSPEQLESAHEMIHHVQEWINLKQSVSAGLDRLMKHSDYTADTTFQLECKQISDQFDRWFSKCAQFIERQRESKVPVSTSSIHASSKSSDSQKVCFLLELAQRAFHQVKSTPAVSPPVSEENSDVSET